MPKKNSHKRTKKIFQVMKVARRSIFLRKVASKVSDFKQNLVCDKRESFCSTYACWRKFLPYVLRWTFYSLTAMLKLFRIGSILNFFIANKSIGQLSNRNQKLASDWLVPCNTSTDNKFICQLGVESVNFETLKKKRLSWEREQKKISLFSNLGFWRSLALPFLRSSESF